MATNPYTKPETHDPLRLDGARDRDFLHKFHLQLRDGLNIPELEWKKFPYASLIKVRGKDKGRAKKPSDLVAMGLPSSSNGGIYAFVISFPDCGGFPDCRYLAYIGETKRPIVERFAEYPNKDMHIDGKGRLHIWNMIYLFWERLEYWCTDKIPSEFETARDLEQAMLTRVFPPFNKAFPASATKIANSIYGS